MSKGMRRPQAPKRRNPVKSHMDDIHFPKVHRDRKKDSRWEDSLDARLQDYLDDLDDENDPDPSGVKKKEFLSKLNGTDPENREDYEEWKRREAFMDEFTDIKGPTEGSLYYSTYHGKIMVYKKGKFVDPDTLK